MRKGCPIAAIIYPTMRTAKDLLTRHLIHMPTKVKTVPIVTYNISIKIELYPDTASVSVNDIVGREVHYKIYGHVHQGYSIH